MRIPTRRTFWQQFADWWKERKTRDRRKHLADDLAQLRAYKNWLAVREQELETELKEITTWQRQHS